MAIPITFGDLQGQAPITGLFKYDFSYTQHLTRFQLT